MFFKLYGFFSIDNNAMFDKDKPNEKMTSYEDLRKKNREEYERQHQLQSQIKQNTPIRRQWGHVDSDQPKSAGEFVSLHNC